MYKPNVSKFISSISTLFLALLALSVAAPAKAQSAMKVNVPFAFESGTSHMAPGVYRIHLNASSPIVRIEGRNSSVFQMALPGEAGHASDTGKLVFHRFGSSYVLKEIWVAGSTSYLRTPKSKTEKQLELAQANANPQSTVALMASR